VSLPITYSIRRRYLDQDLDAVSASLGGRILEVGNGRTGRRGRFQPPKASVSGWMYLDRDRQKRPHVQGDVRQLPFASAIFDAVVCLEVLEYVDSPALALNEMRRALKPGGLLLMSTPFFHRMDAADDYWRFTEAGLRKLLMNAGFEIVQWRAQGSALASSVNVLQYAVSVQRVWLRRIMAVLLRPLFDLLLSIDATASRRQPSLATFTTGYLVIARPGAQEHA